MSWAMLVVGIIVGGVLGWLLGRSRTPAADSSVQNSAAQARVDELRGQLSQNKQENEALRRELTAAQTACAVAETRASEVEKNLVEQRALLKDAGTTLEKIFKSLASDVLSQSNSDFLRLAEQKFSALKDGAASDLDARKTAVEQMVKPIAESLNNYQRETSAMEQRRLQEMGSLDTRLASMTEAQGGLQQETAKLVNALRSPQVRGRWGELTLRRTVELAGMSAHIDFIEQSSVTTEDGRIRPDMIVKLPTGRNIVVDSKVSSAAFLEALEAKVEREREAAMVRHAEQTRTHMKDLSSKQYWKDLPGTPEFVVMFIPNDSFLAAAAQYDPDLIADALERKVAIATPATLVALLRAVEHGWRQEEIAKSAQQISHLGADLYKRIVKFLEYLDKVGLHLKKAVEAYNGSVVSAQSRLLPQAEKFEALGVAAPEPLPDLQQITEEPRIAAQKILPGVEPAESSPSQEMPRARAAGEDE